MKKVLAIVLLSAWGCQVSKEEMAGEAKGPFFETDDICLDCEYKVIKLLKYFRVKKGEGETKEDFRDRLDKTYPVPRYEWNKVIIGGEATLYDKKTTICFAVKTCVAEGKPPQITLIRLKNCKEGQTPERAQGKAGEETDLEGGERDDANSDGNARGDGGGDPDSNYDMYFVGHGELLDLSLTIRTGGVDTEYLYLEVQGLTTKHDAQKFWCSESQEGGSAQSTSRP